MVMQDSECIVIANRTGNLYLFQSINSKCFSGNEQWFLNALTAFHRIFLLKCGNKKKSALTGLYGDDP